jgi:hypothetical protein
MADDETTLTAGIAYLLALACSSRSMRALPVTTPGLTVVGIVEATVLIAGIARRNATERRPSTAEAKATHNKSVRSMALDVL